MQIDCLSGRHSQPLLADKGCRLPLCFAPEPSGISDNSSPGTYCTVNTEPDTALVFIGIMLAVATVSWDASLPHRSHSKIVRMEQGESGWFKS